MRRVFLAICVSVLVLGCRPPEPQVPAPVNRPAVEQIPVDLDVVVRVALGRLRKTVDASLAEVAGRLLAGQARAPSDLVLLALAQTETLWLGIRPDSDPNRWDNVVILEGDFSSISTEQIAEVFGPPRDLGGGFRAYDAKAPAARTAPARLYTYLEERWIIASTAEVDALERVIEGHRMERTLEPPERGLVSISAKLARLSESLAARSPKAAEFAAKAVALEGSASAGTDGFDVEARIEFTAPEEASRTALALSIFWGILRVRDVELSAEAVEKDLVLRLAVKHEAIARWAASAPRDG